MEILSLPAMTAVQSVPVGGVWVLGFFDGVHAGHQALLTAAAEMAGKQENACPVGVWTFASLPKADELLTDSDERASLLAWYGVNLLAVETFSAVSHLSGEYFFRELLLTRLAPSAIVCGFNFRFGYRGQSCAADLVRWGQETGVAVVVIPPCLAEGAPVSSTRIRALVREGKMEQAAGLLTRPYRITGVVEHGRALGRKLGFPTANIRLPKGKVPPARGIYACLVRFTDKDGTENTRPGVCNIGFRPTVNGDSSDVTVETWIQNYSGDLYGQRLEISFYKKIREEKQFATLDALTAQVKQDAAQVREYFAGTDTEKTEHRIQDIES